MKGEVVRFVFIVFAIVLAAAVEELLPLFLGMGFPLLLALVMVAVRRLSVLGGIMTAIGAGAMEAALSSLPPMTAGCFFVVVALVSRKWHFHHAALVAFFPLFEIWTGLCATGPVDDMFVRMLLSAPFGAIALAAVSASAGWAGRKAGLHE